MPTERCWHCDQVKRGVELCPSDDRLCPDCYKANEQRLKEQHVTFSDNAAAARPADEVINSASAATRVPDDVGQSLADRKKTRSKPVRGKKIKEDSTPVQQGSPVVVVDETFTHGAALTQPAMAATSATEEISALRQLVQTQQGTIKKLQSQLNLILSFLGIDDTDTTTTQEDEASTSSDVHNSNVLSTDHDVSAATVNDASSDHQKWSEVVSKRRHHQVDTFKQSVVTALYVDQSLKRSTENSLIVNGLVPVSTSADSELFSNLCV